MLNWVFDVDLVGSSRIPSSRVLCCVDTVDIVDRVVDMGNADIICLTGSHRKLPSLLLFHPLDPPSLFIRQLRCPLFLGFLDRANKAYQEIPQNPIICLTSTNDYQLLSDGYYFLETIFFQQTNLRTFLM